MTNDKIVVDALIRTNKMAGIIGSTEAILEIVQLHLDKDMFDKKMLSKWVDDAIKQINTEFEEACCGEEVFA